MLARNHIDTGKKAIAVTFSLELDRRIRKMFRAGRTADEIMDALQVSSAAVDRQQKLMSLVPDTPYMTRPTRSTTRRYKPRKHESELDIGILLEQPYRRGALDLTPSDFA